MPPSRAEQRSTRSGIFEQIERLSKEELLELLRHPLLFFPIAGLNTNDINTAKGRVLRRKADAEFKVYEEFSVQHPGAGADLTSLANFYKSLSEREAHYKRYSRLWKRADHLEFGDNHAAD